MTNEELQQQLNEQLSYSQSLEKRIQALENPPKPVTSSIPQYDILRVFKLYASLPIFTVARTGTPQQGEIWITNISGTRKLNAFISGTTYSITIT